MMAIHVSSRESRDVSHMRASNPDVVTQKQESPALREDVSRELTHQAENVHVA